MAKIQKDTSLRKAILLSAITGQLINDIEGATETGKQLLDRIIEERNAKLITDWKEAKKKTQKPKSLLQLWQVKLQKIKSRLRFQRTGVGVDWERFVIFIIKIV